MARKRIAYTQKVQGKSKDDLIVEHIMQIDQCTQSRAWAKYRMHMDTKALAYKQDTQRKWDTT